MGYIDFLQAFLEKKEEDFDKSVLPRVKSKKIKVADEDVVAENDFYVVIKIDSYEQLKTFFGGTDWESMFKKEDDSTEKEIARAWKDFSSGKVFLATKRVMGKLEARRVARSESRFNRMRVYPFNDKILIRVFDGKVLYYNTGAFVSETVKVDLPDFLEDSEKPKQEENWIERDDGSIDVIGDVELDDSVLENGMIPWKFNKVHGNFSLVKCKTLVSYKNCPVEVLGNFRASPKSPAISLVGCPEFVGKDFDCDGCMNLRSFRGSPERVGGRCIFSHCNVTDLEGSPRVVGSFYCSYCKKLESLEGGPNVVHGDFVATFCKSLLSLRGLTDNVHGKMDFTGSLLDIGAGALQYALFNRWRNKVPKNFIHPNYFQESYMKWCNKILAERLNTKK